MGRAGGKKLGSDQLFARPDAGKGIQAVGQRFAENYDVRRDAQMLDGPEFSRAIKAHLYFIVYNQDLVLVAGLLEALEIFLGRNHVAARALHRLDIESAVLRGLRLGIPHAVIFGVKEFCELVVAIEVAGLALQAVHAAETIRVKDKMRALAKMSVATAVAITRSDGGGTQRPA